MSDLPDPKQDKLSLKYNAIVKTRLNPYKEHFPARDGGLMRCEQGLVMPLKVCMTIDTVICIFIYLFLIFKSILKMLITFIVSCPE